MYTGRVCFLDVPAVIAVTRDLLPLYHPRLPGYIRDLVSTRGPVVGLVPFDWHAAAQDELLKLLLPVLNGKMDVGKFSFLQIPDADVIGPLQKMKRVKSLHWSRCSCFFGQDKPWMEEVARSLRFGYKELVDRLVLP